MARKVVRRCSEKVDGGFDLAKAGALLDFGCGCARVLRFMARCADNVTLHGADIDAAAIDWCRRHLDYARFHVLPIAPPSVPAAKTESAAPP